VSCSILTTGLELLFAELDVSDFSKQVELVLFGKVGLRDGWTHDSPQVRSHRDEASQFAEAAK
jgi:hypothetical protein